MKFRNGLILLSAVLSCLSCRAREPDVTVEKRIDDLLAQMTVQEKIGQLRQPVLREKTRAEIEESIKAGQVGSFCVVKDPLCDPTQRNRLQKMAIEESRLGIPILFGYDVIHGFKTIFPVSLGLSASWDLEMAEQAARVAAKEARGYGMDMAFSPMVDVSRDPRWGRISECYGEDVLLNAAFGAATVRGYAGDDLADPDTLGACVKHYVGYGLSMGGRDKQFTEVSRQTLLNTYLPPFEACVKAGAVSLMTAFNDQSGVPSTANPYTLTEVLRKQWGFDGFVLSDWDAVVELINHGVAGTESEAAELALEAGTDVEMKSTTYVHLADSIAAGRVSTEVLDEAVRRVLRMKFRLGLFDHPYVNEARGRAVQLLPEHRALARKAAAESMVLLKNNGVLPFPEHTKRVALQGPFAHSRDLYGWWTGHADTSDAVTVYDGLMQAKPDSMQLECGSQTRFYSPVTLICAGESGQCFGESHNLTDITLAQSQVELVKEAKAAGSKVVVVVFGGRPQVLSPIMELADAVLLAWHPGTETGHALADVLFGRVNPCAKLTVSFPKSTGQIPLFYCDRRSGRPREDRYLDLDSNPLFPFGFGLSYTEYTYDNLRLSSPTLTAEGSLTVSVDVTNTGTRDGKEIVQLYIHDKVARITRPQKQLKGFQKVMLKKGEKRTVSFTLNPDDLAFYDADCQRVVEPGVFDLWVGASSQDETLATTFRYE